MKALDAQLDDHPEQAREIVFLDSRNRLAHKELQLYNDHGAFLYRHPLTVARKRYAEHLAELSELRRIDPAILLAESANLTQNIRRIRSNLSRQKYKSGDERQAWEQNLSRAELRQKILEEVIRK
jgi:hypothetical protein